MGEKFPLTAPGLRMNWTWPWRSRRNWTIIYNDPLGYADLILNGDPKEYLKNVSGSRTLED